MRDGAIAFVHLDGNCFAGGFDTAAHDLPVDGVSKIRPFHGEDTRELTRLGVLVWRRRRHGYVWLLVVSTYSSVGFTVGRGEKTRCPERHQNVPLSWTRFHDEWTLRAHTQGTTVVQRGWHEHGHWGSFRWLQVVWQSAWSSGVAPVQTLVEVS